MNKKSIISLMLALIAMIGQAQSNQQLKQSSETTPEKSDSVVKQLGIPFPQIYKSTPMSTYGITSIPHTILFAPDGTILARRLHGDEIEKKLNEIFQ
jgi:uncharacterized membrane protein YhaH (DUF805 family)